MAVTVNIPVASIIVGDRRREEYGAVDELAASIERYGLLHPIVVDIERNLVAGGRRLAAVRQLGMEHVAVRMLDTLSPAERREIELEENLQRKDLTSHELSKELIEDAHAIAERILSTNLVDKPIPRGQKPTYGVPKAEVARALATSTSDLVRAEQHVAAVEQHPILKDEPQATAIDYAKAVKQEPALQGGLVASVVGHYRDNLVRQREQAATPPAEVERVMATLPPPPKEPDEEKRYRTLIDAIERLMSQNPPDDFADDDLQRWTKPLGDTLKALDEWTGRARKSLGRQTLRAVK